MLDQIKFFKRCQKRGESFDEFLTSLKELHKACDFEVKADCKSCQRFDKELFRNRIIVGLDDEETRHKLLAEPKLQLSDAVRIARAEEAARVTKRNMTNVSVNAIRQKSA